MLEILYVVVGLNVVMDGEVVVVGVPVGTHEQSHGRGVVAVKPPEQRHGM